MNFQPLIPVLIITIVVVVYLVWYNNRPKPVVVPDVPVSPPLECTSIADCDKGSDCRMGTCTEITCYQCDQFKVNRNWQDPGSSINYYWDMGFQSTGKVIAAGDSRVTRYNLDGTIDTTFGVSGVFTMAGSPDLNAIFVGADDSILIAHFNDNRITKLTPNGILDTTFDTDGIKTIPQGRTLTVYSDASNNVFVGTGDGIAKLLANGAFDNSFGVSGYVNLSTLNVDLQAYSAPELGFLPDGKILVGGTFEFDGDLSIAILRLNPDGTLDTTYGTNGFSFVRVNDFGYQAQFCNDSASYGSVYTSDGTAYITAYVYMNYLDAGCDSAPLVVLKFNPDGTLDTTYGNNGVFIYQELDNSQVSHFHNGSILPCDGSLALALTVKRNTDIGVLIKIAADGKSYKSTHYENNDNRWNFNASNYRDGIIYVAAQINFSAKLLTYEC